LSFHCAQVPATEAASLLEGPSEAEVGMMVGVMALEGSTIVATCVEVEELTIAMAGFLGKSLGHGFNPKFELYYDPRWCTPASSSRWTFWHWFLP